MKRNTPNPSTLLSAVKKCKTADEVFSILLTVEPPCIKRAENCQNYLVAEGRKGEVRIIDNVDIVPERNIRGTTVGKAGEIVIWRENLPPCGPVPSGSERDCEDEMLHFSEEAILPEDFYIKESICGAKVIISLGRVGFTEKAIKQIGFDLVKYIKDQSKEICKLSMVCNQMEQQLQEVSLKNDEVKLALEEATRPLAKKFFDFISRKFKG